MSLRHYLILIGTGSLIAWATWVSVLFTVNPFESGPLGFLLFYAALAVSLVGTLALVGFGIRLLVYRHEQIVLHQVTTAFRQACLLTVVLEGSLFLQSHELLAWWSVLLFILAITIIELFFLSSHMTR